MNSFKQNIIDLFSGKRGGHVNSLLYSDNLRKDMSGSQLWHAFLRANKNYYVLPNEVAIIKNLSKNIDTLFPNIDVIADFGVGDLEAINHKTIPILKGLKNVGLYQGIDLSCDFLKAAERAIIKQLPNIQIENIEGDFYQDDIALSEGNTLGLMLGSTITNQEMHEGENFPRERIVQKLRHIRNTIGNDNKMLVTYDANPDPISAMNAYDNLYWARQVTGIMYDVAQIASNEFSPSAWAHKMVWDEKSHVIHQCAVATQEQSFSIDQHSFSISKGQRFVTINTFKYSTALFQSMCEEAGFKVEATISGNQDRIRLQQLIA